MASQFTSRLFLFFPFPLIAAAAAMIFLHPTLADSLTLDFIVDVLFLGAIHNYLSISLLFLPAASIWLSERKKAGRHSFALFSILIVTCMFAFILWRSLTFGQNTEVRLNIIAVTTFLFATLGLHHTMWQVKGVSFTLEHRLKDESPQHTKAPARIFKNDHQAFYILLALAIVMPALHGIVRLDPTLRAVLNFRIIALTASAGMLLVIAALVVPLFKSSAPGDKTRGWYLLRLTAWALTPLSRYGFLAAGAIHGIEYFFVILQLFKGESRRLLIGSSVALIGIAIPLRIAATKFTADPANATAAIIGLNAMALTIGLTHYYWDRILFAMRHPETRTFLGQKLVGQKPKP